MLLVLVVALLAAASPAHAATPVSDQYQSAPAPIVDRVAPPAAEPASAARAATGPASTPAAGAPAGSAPARPPAAAATPKPAPAPLLVDADPADAPLAAPASELPIGMLAVIGLLVLALACTAAVRTRRPTAGA